MKYKLVVFSLNGCGHCMLLKTNLDHLKIPYTEIEVSQNQKVWMEIVEQTKQDRIPIVHISKVGSDDGKMFLPEVDYKSIDELVNIIKSYFLP